MTEAATATTSMNPNVPVGAEGTTESQSNSDVSFDDVADNADVKRPKLVKDNPPKAPKAKQESDPFSEVEDVKPSPKAKPVEKKDEKAEPKADAGKPDPKAGKPRVIKAKSGESTVEVMSDAVFPVRIGKDVSEVPLQELINNYSGKTAYETKFNDLHKERTEFTKSREQLNTMIAEVHTKALKDPEAAFDFLASLTKQDPVKLKGEILRKQFEEMLPLYDMDPAARETYFKDRERDWRDKAHANREAAEKEREAQTAEQAKRDETTQQYGIDEDGWKKAEALVSTYLKKVDPKFDGKVTTEQVVFADRQLMALEVIGQTVPHLESHPKFDSIVGDIVQDLIRHPSMTREKLATLLTDVWAEDKDKGLKNLARKAAKNAQIAPETPRAPKRDSGVPVTFDDID